MRLNTSVNGAKRTFDEAVRSEMCRQKQTNSQQINFRSAALSAYSRSPAAFRAA